MKDTSFEEYIKVIDQLKPKAQRDVHDYSAFVLFTQTRKPAAPFLVIMRGGWLFILAKKDNMKNILKDILSGALPITELPRFLAWAIFKPKKL